MSAPTIPGLEMIEQIGLGGAAEVYRAVDAEHREVAVKVLSQRAEPAMVARFVREGQALQRLEHPHIVQVFAAGETQGARYLVMELARGGSLKDRLQQAKFGWREAVQVALGLARALAHAHAHGVVHRDVKPANVLFSDDGEPKLTDFGLAHLDDASAMTRTGTVMGTVLYLSPEQALGQPVDGRSDLYALGAVLFEMLTGEPPFSGDSAVGVIYKQLHEPPRRPSCLEPTVPAALDATVARLLQKQPAQRYHDAAACCEALEELLNAPERALSVSLPEGHPSATRDEAALPLAGRAPELAQLGAALEAAFGGVGRLLLISGEAGVGKTRLARELLDRARLRGGRALYTACLYSDAPHPYAPIVELLHSLGADVANCAQGSEEPWNVGDALVSARRALRLPAEGPQVASRTPVVSPREGQEQVLEILTTLIHALAQESPLLLVLDDLQWASPATLQWLHYLARGLGESPVLLVGLYRPEDLLPDSARAGHTLAETLRRMGRERLYEEMRLAPLDGAAFTSLAEAALNVTHLETEFVDLLLRESEGNPFYLLETLRLLQDQGALEQVGDHWTLAAALADLEVPQGILDLVMRRVDRVTDEERDLLAWCAVQGRRLDVDVLSDVFGASRLAVMRSLYGLQQRHGLLAADEYGFQFAHDKIREVLYEDLPEPLRREYHLAVGQSMEARYEAEKNKHVYALAMHWGRGRHAKGHHYALLAADAAEASFAPSEAVDYLALALDLLPLADVSLPDQLNLKHRYARLLATVGEQEAAQRTLVEVLSLCRELDDRVMQATTLLDLANVHGRVGDWEAARSLGQQSYDLASALGDLGLQAQALLSTGFFAFEQGSWEEAISRLEQAADVATHTDSPVLRARIWGNLAIVRNARGEHEHAVQLFQQSVDTFAKLDQPLDVVRGLSNEGFALYRMERYEQAMGCYSQALEWLPRVGDVREQGLLHLHIAEARVALTQFEQARQHCGLAARRFSRIGFELGLADVDRIYASIARAEGRWRVAERFLREAIAVYQEHEDPLNLAESCEELGRLLEEVGQLESAREQLERSRTVFSGLLHQTAGPP